MWKWYEKPSHAQQTLSRLIAEQYYERTWGAPTSAALSAALDALEFAGAVRWSGAQGRGADRRA